MSKVITLSENIEVHMKEKFTHKAEAAYSSARDAGAFDEETFVDGVLHANRRTPVENYAKAIEAALLVMIEKVKVGEAEATPTLDWLNTLDENDYDALGQAMLEVRKAGRERGKKIP